MSTPEIVPAEDSAPLHVHPIDVMTQALLSPRGLKVTFANYAQAQSFRTRCYIQRKKESDKNKANGLGDTTDFDAISIRVEDNVIVLTMGSPVVSIQEL